MLEMRQFQPFAHLEEPKCGTLVGRWSRLEQRKGEERLQIEAVGGTMGVVQEAKKEILAKIWTLELNRGTSAML